MSGAYLQKLRALKSQNGTFEAPSKPSKLGIEGFDGTQHAPLPNFPGRYRRVLAALEVSCPYLVPADRWQQAVEDGRAFLAQWGSQAEALGWTARDLFGLHQPPAKPHPSYSRLSRYDETGLIWLLEGRKVLALTAETAAIHNPSGSITTFRRHARTALGPAATASTISKHERGDQ